MKTKKQKGDLSNRGNFLGIMIVLFIFLVAIFLILFFSVLKTNYETEKIHSNNYHTNTKSVEITTDKNSYLVSEKINLTIKNNEKQSIYFEPCEYLNDFEKKMNGKWRKSLSHEGIKVYDEFGFKREKNVTNCEIELPKEGAGTYRTVIQIYYECESPGEDMCKDSEVFYSNEFEVE